MVQCLPMHTFLSIPDLILWFFFKTRCLENQNVYLLFFLVYPTLKTFLYIVVESAHICLSNTNKIKYWKSASYFQTNYSHSCHRYRNIKIICLYWHIFDNKIILKNDEELFAIYLLICHLIGCKLYREVFDWFAICCCLKSKPIRLWV